MADYSQMDRLQWIEPTNPPTDPIVPVLLNLIGIFVPISGVGHIVLGQKSKGIFFLVLVLIFFAPIVLCFIPFINLISLPLLGILAIFRLFVNIYLLIDAYYLAERLRRGIPITINESSFFAFPLLSKVTKNPSCVSDSPNNPPEYFERVSQQQTVIVQGTIIATSPQQQSNVAQEKMQQQPVQYQQPATNYGATQTTMYPGENNQV